MLLSVTPPRTTLSLLDNARNREVAVGIVREAITTSAPDTSFAGAAPAASAALAAATGATGTLESDVLRLLLAHADLATHAASPALQELVIALPLLLPIASAAGDLETVRLLLQVHNVDANMLGANSTPLIAALRKGHIEVARLLLAHRADPNAFAAHGSAAPLHVCVMRADVEGVKLLLGAAANPNAPLRSGAHSGCTPLKLAVTAVKNERIAHLLMCGGAVAEGTTTERDLSSMSLTDADASAFLARDSAARSITSLNLSSNVLCRPDLPAWPYRALTSLRLSSNRLAEVPRGLQQLSSLTYLDLSVNAITDLGPLREDHPVQLAGLCVRGNPLNWY